MEINMCLWRSIGQREVQAMGFVEAYKVIIALHWLCIGDFNEVLQRECRNGATLRLPVSVRWLMFVGCMI